MLLYGLMVVHVPVAVYLLGLSAEFWHEVRLDRFALRRSSRTDKYVRIALLYADGHMRMSIKRLYVAVLHFALMIILAGSLLTGGTILRPNLAFLSRLVIFVLTALQAWIVHVDYGTRSRMIDELGVIQRQEQA